MEEIFASHVYDKGLSSHSTTVPYPTRAPSVQKGPGHPGNGSLIPQIPCQFILTSRTPDTLACTTPDSGNIPGLHIRYSCLTGCPLWREPWDTQSMPNLSFICPMRVGHGLMHWNNQGRHVMGLRSHRTFNHPIRALCTENRGITPSSSTSALAVLPRSPLLRETWDPLTCTHFSFSCPSRASSAQISLSLPCQYPLQLKLSHQSNSSTEYNRFPKPHQTKLQPASQSHQIHWVYRGDYHTQDLFFKMEGALGVICK